jgi:hypothetical protein
MGDLNDAAGDDRCIVQQLRRRSRMLPSMPTKRGSGPSVGFTASAIK